MKKNPSLLWWPVLTGVGMGAGTLYLVGALHARQLFQPGRKEEETSDPKYNRRA